MSRYLIALRGSGNSGKTETINLLRAILNENGLSEIDGKNGKNDFWSIHKYQDLRIGLTSSGDTFGVLRNKLDLLTEKKCYIIVCACRTSGYTNDLINDKAGFEARYVEKSKGDKTLYHRLNRQDAQTLFELIKEYLP